ncbi:hypothetical protein GNI_029080 [Gregarina niphandrodes]|uniref:Uncharacterized protein n=1 Tax=Gregarina niphandrodes TaxID=110365 RepID=A0A023BBE3_GRENI|nr:hypothetical protein GNI_029080 [Gregarina niphandrodes]EZG79152.1 hypothetical protein GNI_029080 [Gregarina niphandrodes]|eukprot:XP_011129123.1 hypothetical protein GNI_029080 [Gregarina niphandrodes]
MLPLNYMQGVFVIVTDDWGKYHGMDGYGSGLNTTTSTKWPAQRTVGYQTLVHTLETCNVVPITLVLEDSVEWWTNVWSKELKLKADRGQFGAFTDMETTDAGGVANTVLESVNTVNGHGIKTATT